MSYHLLVNYFFFFVNTSEKTLISLIMYLCTKYKVFLLDFSIVHVSGVFLFCWVPFFTCNILDAICNKLDKDCSPGVRMFILTTWLGYMNSFVNPVIYTIFNPEFRKAFKKIMRIGTWPVADGPGKSFASNTNRGNWRKRVPHTRFT